MIESIHTNTGTARMRHWDCVCLTETQPGSFFEAVWKVAKLARACCTSSWQPALSLFLLSMQNCSDVFSGGWVPRKFDSVIMFCFLKRTECPKKWLLKFLLIVCSCPSPVTCIWFRSRKGTLALNRQSREILKLIFLGTPFLKYLGSDTRSSWASTNPTTKISLTSVRRWLLQPGLRFRLTSHLF